MIGGLDVRALHLPVCKKCETGSVFRIFETKTVIKSCEKHERIQLSISVFTLQFTKEV